MAYVSKWKGQEIDDSIQTVVDKSNVWDNKQDKLTGREGQIVGFDALHNAIAIDLNDSDTVTSFNGRVGDVLPQTGDYTATMVGAKDANWMPTPSDIGALSDDTFIPTKISELENDSGYITSDDINVDELKDIVKCEGGATIEISSEIGEAPHVITITLEDDDGGDSSGGGNSGEATIVNGLPTGGTTGQILAKKSSVDYDTEWVNKNSGGTTDNLTASDISYSGSNLSSTDVKGAIDELAQEKQDKVSGVAGQVLGFDNNGNIVAVDATSGEDIDLSGYALIQDPVFKGNIQLKSYMGNNTFGSSICKDNFIIGTDNSTTNGNRSLIVGNKNNFSGGCSFCIGANNNISGSSACFGDYCKSNGLYSITGGYSTIAGYCELALGRYNVQSSNTSLNSQNTIIVGNGSSSARSNAFRVNSSGSVYGTGNFNSSGADYAEMFEWLDQNPNNEDRRGLFVTLKGNKIKLANSNDDFILGIVSGNPSVVGGVHDDQWKDMYERDIFGAIIYEEVEVPEESIKVPSEKKQKRMAKKVINPKHKEMVMKLNPNYDNTQQYTPRTERKEWSAVGMLGQLVTVDDGLCEVDGYCKPGKNGIAVWSNEKTKYRVIERLDGNHIKVLII